MALGLAMKWRAFVGVLLCVWLCVGAAEAGDTAVYKAASVPTAISGFFYTGVSLGERWSDTAWTTTAIGAALSSPDARPANPQNFDSGTARIGGYAGYVWRFTPTWVAGFEGDLAWGHSDKTVSGISGTCSVKGCGRSDRASVEEGWDGSIRARLGFLVTPSWLVYGTGGIAWQGFEVGGTCGGAFSACAAPHGESVSVTRSGWTLGAGVDVMLRHNWLARLEYRFADYGRLDHTFFAHAPADQVAMSEALKTRTLLIGFHYRFDGAQALVAKH